MPENRSATAVAARIRQDNGVHHKPEPVPLQVKKSKEM
jgi:hypothetical protein